MIARARGDHHERDAMLGGDAGHQGLRAVASGDAEQIGALCHGLARHLGDVDGLGPADEKHLGAKVFRLALQVEFLDFPAAGLRIHDQVRMPGRRLRRMLGHAPVHGIPGQRHACGHAREQPRRGRDDGHPQHPSERENDDHGDRREGEDRERQPAPYAPPGQEEERGDQAHDRGGPTHSQHRQAPQPGKNHQDHDRHGHQHEAQTRQPALGGRALRTHRGRHGSRRPGRPRKFLVLSTARSSHGTAPAPHPLRGT